MEWKELITKRSSALALFVGGLLGVLAHSIHPNPPGSAHEIHSYVHSTVRAHLLLGTAVLLVCLGLPALFDRLNAQESLVRFLSFPALFLGLMLSEFLHCPVEVAIFPELQSLDYSQASSMVMHIFQGPTPYAAVQSLGTLLLLVGVCLFTIGTRRSTQVKRWPRYFFYLFFLFLVCTYLPIPWLPSGRLFAICFYLSFAGYGLELVRHPLVRVQVISA